MQKKQYPALFLVYSTEEARWVDMEKSTEYEIASYRDLYDRYSDCEGRFGTNNRRGMSNKGGEPEVLNARKRDHVLHHIRTIAQKTAEYWRQGHYAVLGFIAPEQIKNILKKELQKYLPQIPLKEIYGDYVHVPIHSIRKIIKKQDRLMT